VSQFSEFLNSHDKKIAALISLSLIVIMSMTLANGVWFVMENMGEANVVLSDPETSRHQNRKQIDISKLNVFGKEQVAAVKRDVTNVPKTSLNLELQGIFASEDTSRSKALIAPRGKAGELYNLGDKLPGNAVLDSVFSDYVLIKRGARIEKLSFPEGTMSKNNQFLAGNNDRQISSSPNQNNTRLQNIQERIQNRQRNTPNENAGKLEKKYQTADLQQSLTAYQNRLNTEPDSVLSELGMSAVTEGEASGYRIGGQVSSKLLQQSGLQQGDVILSVNGKPVGNVASDQGLINQVVASKRARVEVQRGSRKFVVTVPINN
jgi:general secretion pathway protein C